MAIGGGDGSIVLTTKVDESGLSSGLSKLKSGVGAFGKAFAAVGVAAASAFVGITKAAVDSYAEFEQLSGGVQKIFDEIDYSKIAEDAGNAYKTMGMSANEYLGVMTTVGANFASTLGDAKGYEVAKQGMQAISDFASGTGRSVDELSEKYQMITKSTSSYQSIADQFAGILPATSAGFLEQAQAAGFLSESYTKLTDVPMAEYQEAVTQMLSKGVDALGLTGNTAMEAATTLSGSTAMMKASWQNLLTGMADPTQNFEQLLQNFISSVGTFAGNLLPVIQTAAQGVLQMVQGLLPQLATMVSQMLPMVVEGAVGIVNGIVQVAPQIVEAIVGLLPQLLTATTNLITQIATALPALMQVIVSALPTIIQSIVVALPAMIPALINGIVQAIIILVAAFPQIIQPIIDNLPMIITSITGALLDNLPILINACIQLVVAIVAALPKIISALLKAIGGIAVQIGQTLFETLPKPIQNAFKSAFELVKAIWDKVQPYFAVIWEGIKAVFSVVGAVLGGFFETAWAAIKAVWDVVTGYFSAIWDTIAGIFSVVASVLSGNWSDAWEAIKGIVNGWVAYFQTIWSGIKGVFSAVGSWFSSTFSAAWNAVKNVWGNVKTFFAGVWSNIKGAFKIGEMSQIGGDIVKGLWEGINNLTAWIAGKIKSFCSNALQAIKDFFEIESPSKKTIEVGKYLVEGLARGIDGNRKKAIKSMRTLGADVLREMHKTRQKEIDEIKKSIADKEYEFSRLPKTMQQYTSDAHKAEIKALEDQIKTLEEQQKNYESFFDAYKTYTDNMLKLEEDYSANVKKVKDKLADDIEAANERYTSAFESRVESIKSELSIFEEAEKGEAVASETLTTALNSQIDLLEDYNAALENLSSKNVDSTFIEEMKAMGIDVLPQLEALNNMTEEELTNYVALWEEKNRLATEATTKELKTMREETDAEIVKLRENADKELDGLRQDYKKNVLEFTKELGLSMQQIGEDSIKSLGLQVTLYTQTGSNLMQGLADGIESEKDSIIAGVVDNVVAAIEAAKEAAGIHSPSTVMRDEVGKNLMLGLANGIVGNEGVVSTAMSRVAKGLANTSFGIGGFNMPRMASGTVLPYFANSIVSNGVNSIQRGANYQSTSNEIIPINVQIMLDRRELGSAVVEVSQEEIRRTGGSLVKGARLVIA